MINFIYGIIGCSVVIIMINITGMNNDTGHSLETQQKQYKLDSLRYELEIKEAAKRDSILFKVDIIFRDFLPAK